MDYKQEYEATTGQKFIDEDWLTFLSPVSNFIIHKPTAKSFKELSGHPSIELVALATGLLDSMPESEHYGELTGTVQELEFMYCIGFFGGRKLIYSATGMRRVEHKAMVQKGTKVVF